MRKESSPPAPLKNEASLVRSLIKALRPHQWAKNLLILLPPLLSHNHSHSSADCPRFSLSFASAALHQELIWSMICSTSKPTGAIAKKRLRPFRIGRSAALCGSCRGCSSSGCGICWRHNCFPCGSTYWLLVYLVSTLAYSLYLKRIALVDVVVLSGLYTLRLLAGGAATKLPSPIGSRDSPSSFFFPSPS